MSNRQHRVSPTEVIELWDLVSREDCRIDVQDDGRVKLRSPGPIQEWLITKATRAVDGLDALAMAAAIVDSFDDRRDERAA
jgi:hypothetical protein